MPFRKTYGYGELAPDLAKSSFFGGQVRGQQAATAERQGAQRIRQQGEQFDAQMEDRQAARQQQQQLTYDSMAARQKEGADARDFAVQQGEQAHEYRTEEIEQRGEVARARLTAVQKKENARADSDIAAIKKWSADGNLSKAQEQEAIGQVLAKVPPAQRAVWEQLQANDGYPEGQAPGDPPYPDPLGSGASMQTLEGGEVKVVVAANQTEKHYKAEREAKAAETAETKREKEEAETRRVQEAWDKHIQDMEGALIEKREGLEGETEKVFVTTGTDTKGNPVQEEELRRKHDDATVERMLAGRREQLAAARAMGPRGTTQREVYEGGMVDEFVEDPIDVTLAPSSGGLYGGAPHKVMERIRASARLSGISEAALAKFIKAAEAGHKGSAALLRQLGGLDQ